MLFDSFEGNGTVLICAPEDESLSTVPNPGGASADFFTFGPNVGADTPSKLAPNPIVVVSLGRFAFPTSVGVFCPPAFAILSLDGDLVMLIGSSDGRLAMFPSFTTWAAKLDEELDDIAPGQGEDAVVDATMLVLRATGRIRLFCCFAGTTFITAFGALVAPPACCGNGCFFFFFRGTSTFAGPLGAFVDIVADEVETEALTKLGKSSSYLGFEGGLVAIVDVAAPGKPCRVTAPLSSPEDTDRAAAAEPAPTACCRSKWLRQPSRMAFNIANAAPTRARAPWPRRGRAGGPAPRPCRCGGSGAAARPLRRRRRPSSPWGPAGSGPDRRRPPGEAPRRPRGGCGPHLRSARAAGRRAP